MSKLTYEFIKKQFEKEEYFLLSKEYINNLGILKYSCPFGHRHFTTRSRWVKGTRCPYCAKERKKSDILNKIKYIFLQEGYILLSNKYINSGVKLKYVCPLGHKHSISWENWYSGKRCFYCSGKAKLTIEQVKSSFEKDGYTLVSKEYTNNVGKLDYICSLGHKHSTTWSNWNNSFRCPACAIIKNYGIGNGNWQGGISYEPYCPIWQDKEYKEDIKLRDGYKCLNPYCDSKKSNDLVIHHIDYNKKNCGPNNLITVCKSCNSKANSDREWHTAWYQTIIYRRYISKTKH